VEAHKFESRSEALAALLVVGRDLLEQARAEQAERARAAAEAEAAAAAAAEAEVAAAAAAAEVAAAEAAAERLRMEARRDELALELQQMNAQLGVTAPVAPAPQPQEEEEALCLVCMDAPKLYAMVPCMHVCACEACAQQLLHTVTRSCPVCREPIQRTTRVFF